MPRVKAAHAPFYACVNLNGAHAMRPIRNRQFTPARNPRLMRNPLPWRTLIETTVVAAIALDYPNTVGEWPRIKQQIVVIGAELQMRHRVTLQDDPDSSPFRCP